jgi:hypothetical protein
MISDIGRFARKKQGLRYPLVGIDEGREWRGIADLDGYFSLPTGF